MERERGAGERDGIRRLRLIFSTPATKKTAEVGSCRSGFAVVRDPSPKVGRKTQLSSRDDLDRSDLIGFMDQTLRNVEATKVGYEKGCLLI